MPLKVGDPAPDFSLPDENGNSRKLSDYRGKPVVLYFYPRDDTPGCTKEACGFRDDYGEYDQADVVILGVSPDTPKSHAKFKAKYDLPFTLLADAEREVVQMYEVWGPKTFMGRTSDGVFRTTFLIGPDGKIIQIFKNVKPEGHSQEILAALEATG